MCVTWPQVSTQQTLLKAQWNTAPEDAHMGVVFRPAEHIVSQYHLPQSNFVKTSMIDEEIQTEQACRGNVHST